MIKELIIIMAINTMPPMNVYEIKEAFIECGDKLPIITQDREGRILKVECK